MAKVIPEGHCHICEEFIEVLVRTYNTTPWYDGKCYSEICFTCFSTIRRIKQEDDGSWSTCSALGDDRIYLYSLEEMKEDGWRGDSEYYAKRSLESVRRLLKKSNVTVARYTPPVIAVEEPSPRKKKVVRRKVKRKVKVKKVKRL